MALIVGIYESLIRSIEEGFRAALSFVRFDHRRGRSHLAAVDWHLLVPLATGIAIALLIAARYVPDLLDRYPVQAKAAFLGMVAASIAIPWRRMTRVEGGPVMGRTPLQLMILALAALLAFFLTGLPPGSVQNPTWWQVVSAAMVAICAMILPGISGAFLLLALGMYEPTLRAVDDRDLVYVALFVVGAGVGLGSFSIVLNRLLATRHDQTMAALVGLMAGSLRALWPWQGPNRELLAPGENVVMVALLAMAGLLVVLAIERFSRTAGVE